MDDVKLLHKDRDEVRFILQRVMKEYSDVCYENDRLRHALGLCKIVFDDLLQPSASGYVKYAMHHETIRDDVRRLMPTVLEALK